jgi:hypothetical protein
MKVPRARPGLARARGLAAAIVAAAALGSAVATSAPAASGADALPGRHVQIVDTGVTRVSRVPAPPHAARMAQSATFQVTYDANFDANPAAKAAFQAAIDIWSSQLSATVPITVNAQFRSDLGQNVLGSAGATDYWRNFTGAPMRNTFYPVTLGSALAGLDLNTSNGVNQPMIDASFSSVANWYFGTDGETPPDKTDFESVVLHEVGHGLGFAGSAEVVGGAATIGLGASATPVIYDRFVADGNGNQPYLLAGNSALLLSIYTSNNLYWNGPLAMANNNGQKPRLYAPSTWQDGSSYSHLNDATYPAGNPNALMTHAISRGESRHDPGPIVRGMFADMGWTIPAESCATPTPTGQTPVPTALANRAWAPAMYRVACG